MATLIDNFVKVSMRMEKEEAKLHAAAKKATSRFQNPLEPLVAKLAEEYTDSASLSARLAALFQVSAQ